jgi:hypothetical protein
VLGGQELTIVVQVPGEQFTEGATRHQQLRARRARQRGDLADALGSARDEVTDGLGDIQDTF